MKTEINFRETSKLIRSLKSDGYVLTSLDEYPTSRNAKIWIDNTDAGWATSYYLVSYECVPVWYVRHINTVADPLSIRIRPDDLTATTRRHIYAFIRQFVPEKQAQVIINSVRATFECPATQRDKITGDVMYIMTFDVYHE